MATRRFFLCGIGAAFSQLPQLSSAKPQNASFEVLLSQALQSPELLTETRSDREGRQNEYDIFGQGKGMAPRYKPSITEISTDAIELIKIFEISNKSVYKNKYRKPIWPKGKSGVTIGVGYDIGYADPAWVAEDWNGILNKSKIDMLAGACRITGAPASQLVPALQSVSIEWEDAEKQFLSTSLPRYVAQTEASLKNTKELSKDSLGALVSLVYNRGPSFKLTGNRYAEMRAIRVHMVKQEFDKIPQEIRNMARLWKDTAVSGLVTRRLLEAALFERGLAGKGKIS